MGMLLKERLRCFDFKTMSFNMYVTLDRNVFTYGMLMTSDANRFYFAVQKKAAPTTFAFLQSLFEFARIDWMNEKMISTKLSIPRVKPSSIRMSRRGHC